MQYQTMCLIKSLLRYEKNQQVMCNAHFVHDILATCKCALYDETHFLHAVVQHVFERLAAQYIQPKCLRDYLRSETIFDPLYAHVSQQNINNFETKKQLIQIKMYRVNKNKKQLVGKQHEQALLPLSRIKCLIAMTMPRDSRLSNTTASAAIASATSFVEFNMSSEGFGCLFLPSIAPQLVAPQSIVAMGMVAVSSNASGVNGGVGAGERTYPFPSGFTFSTWICVEKWGSGGGSGSGGNSSSSSSSLSSSPFSPGGNLQKSKQQHHHHPIRLLTLLKHARLKDTLATALSVHISTKTRSLVVSTEERALHMDKYDYSVDGDDDCDDVSGAGAADCANPSSGGGGGGGYRSATGSAELHTARFQCSELFNEGQWMHVALVWTRASMLKPSTCAFYMNGKHVASQRLHYLGAMESNATPASVSVHAVIGTLPVMRMQVPLVWRQASW